MKRYVCIDIGGTAIKHSVIDDSGKFLEKGQTDTEAYKGGSIVLDKIKEIVNGYLKGGNVDGISISTAGIIEPDKGEVIFASDRLPGYTGTKLKENLEKEFNIKTEVENDVNCAGLSESFAGAGVGAKICVCLTIGTGIGGCIIDNNKIFHGFSNSACEVGYINVHGEDFQEIASTSTMVKKVAELKHMPEEDIDGKKIFELAKQGDKICNDAIDELVEILSIGIADIVYVVNPEVVILGGGIMAQSEFLESKFSEAIKKKITIENIYKNTRIAFAQNGNDAGMLGAYYNFIQRHS